MGGIINCIYKVASDHLGFLRAALFSAWVCVQLKIFYSLQYCVVSEHYYTKEKLNVGDKSEEALSDFINNPQALILQSYVNNEDVLLYTKVSL